MGKIIIEIVLAATAWVAIFGFVWWVCKRWFFKGMPKHIRTIKDISDAADKYDHELGPYIDDFEEEDEKIKASR